MEYPIISESLSSYPEQLHEIPHPPKTLYRRGNSIDPKSHILAVVGSRKHSAYGKAVCERIISELSGSNIVIVSGLALGIDSIAHDTALRVGLTTIAVPGSGLSDSVIYPRTNLSLAHRILSHGGTLLSEFEPDFRATTWSFPQRNRIMAGLSHVVLIIEAKPRSGTLITARLATDFNRDVCAVPGEIFSELSQGPNELIRDGATPIHSGNDILNLFGIKTQESAISSPDVSLLPDEERSLLSSLDSPRDRDDLTRELGLSASSISIILMRLEIAGYIAVESNMIRRTYN